MVKNLDLSFLYGTLKVAKKIFVDTNIENGGFRGLLDIDKMVSCRKLCCNIAKLKKNTWAK